MRLEFGLRVYCLARVAEDLLIGLYLPGTGNSELRWATGPVTSTVPFKQGLLVHGSITNVSQSVDVRRQGNTQAVGGLSFSLDNTQKIYAILEQAGVYINGLSAELIAFDIENNTETVMYRGICEVDEWDETKYLIKIVAADNKRKANVATQILSPIAEQPGAYETTDVPVVYGKIDKVPFVRSSSEENILKLSDYYSATEMNPNKHNLFPCIEYSISNNVPEVYLRLSNSSTLTESRLKELYSFVGKYLYTKDGKGAGQYRQIQSVLWKPSRSVNTDEILQNRFISIAAGNYLYHTSVSAGGAPDLKSSSYSSSEAPKDVLVVDGQTGYMLTASAVWKTIDEGQTYTKLTTSGLANASIFCGAQNTFYVRDLFYKIFRSTDEGVTFSQVFDPSNWGIQAIACSTATPTLALAVGQKIWRTTNGTTWTEITIPGTGNMSDVKFYAGNFYVARSARVYYSSNGDSWTALAGSPQAVINGLYIGPAGKWAATANADDSLSKYLEGDSWSLGVDTVQGGTFTSSNYIKENTTGAVARIISYAGGTLSIQDATENFIVGNYFQEYRDAACTQLTGVNARIASKTMTTGWRKAFVLDDQAASAVWMSSDGVGYWGGPTFLGKANKASARAGQSTYATKTYAPGNWPRISGYWGTPTQKTANYSDYPIVKLTLSNWFEEPLFGNWEAANDEDNEVSWCQIIDIDRTFEIENTDCVGPLTEDLLNTLNSNFVVYSYDRLLKLNYDPISGEVTSDEVRDYGSSFKRLPGFAFRKSGTENRVLELVPEYVEDDPNTILSYTYVNPSSISYPNSLTLDEWFNKGDYDVPNNNEPYQYNENGDSNLTYDWMTYKPSKKGHGLYTSGPWNANGFKVTPNSNEILPNLIDKDSSTYVNWKFEGIGADSQIGTANQTYRSWFCLEIDPPDLKDLEYDEIYLCLRYSHPYMAGGGYNPQSSYAVLRTRRFYEGIISCKNDYYTGKNWTSKWAGFYGTDTIGADFNNFLYEYWDTPPAGGQSYNRAHYDYEYQSGTTRLSMGYRYFKLQDDLENVDKFLLLMNCWGTFDLKLYELQFLVKKKKTIKNEIYVPFAGRTDGSALINNPVDVARDLCKRQNWSELSIDPPASGWGKGYASSTLIKQSPDTEIGSFDYAGLDEMKANVKCNFIETSYQACWTDRLIKKLCNQFWLMSYRDNEGKDCIDHFTLAFPESITQTITLNQIVGKIDPIIYPDQKDIYCNPKVLYNKDPATGEYRNYIAVTNAEQNDYDPSYIEEYGKDELDVSITNETGGTFTVGNYVKGSTSNAVALIKTYTPESPTSMAELELQSMSTKFTTSETLTEYSDEACTTATGVSAELSSKLDPYGIWDMAHTLWIKFHQTNEPPTSMTNLDMVTDRETAAWYLKTWLTWQNKKRIAFSLPYSLAAHWHVGTRFQIRLPHQTNDVLIYCMAEKILKSVPLKAGSDIVKITAVMYNLDDYEDNIIQDIYDGVNYDWDDTAMSSAKGMLTQDSPI